ncbi:MAG: MFS transporter [Clostridia bacterium]|nr:MFS transporter [Clostridia bacterium]
MTRQARGTLAVAGSAAAIFWPGAMIFGYPGVMAPHWQTVFGVGRAAIGNCLFFVLAALGVFMFLVGRWQEKAGTRVMITIGAALCGLAVPVAAYAGHLYLIYLWAFLTGTSSCFVYIPALTTVQRWFPERRGLVSGMVNLTFGLSAAIMSPIFNGLLKAWGYVPMNLLVMAVALAVGLVAAQFTETPERACFTDVGALPRPGSAPPRRKPGPSLTVAQTLRTASFWFLWLVWAMQGAAGIGMVTLSVMFGLSRGYSLEGAVLVLTAFNLTNGFSRIITGYVSDLVGRNITMSLAFLAAGIAYFVLPFIWALAGVALLAAVVGFAFGTLFAVSAPLATDCFGIRHFGAIFGLVFTAYGFVAGALGPSLGGYLADLTGSFVPVFAYLGAFCLISGVFIHFVTPPLGEAVGVEQARRPASS